MDLTKSNDYEQLAAMLHGRHIESTSEKLRKKFLYTEGIIRFLGMYCQNELGSGEVDITKVCLWVNSPWFENNMLRYIETIDDVYKILELDILHDAPLYRLLSISDHLRSILETDHKLAVQEQLIENAKHCPCLDCIWYYTKQHSLGLIAKCEAPSDSPREMLTKRGFHDATKIKTCNKHTTLDHMPTEIKKLYNKEDHSTWDNIKQKYTNAKNRWDKMFNDIDNSIIPKSFEDISLESVTAALKEDPFCDLARVCNNKQGYDEIRQNLCESIVLKGMIEFIEVYTSTELGADYVADITKIANEAYKARSMGPLRFTSVEDVYVWLENRILSGEDMSVFCRHNAE